MYKFDNNEELKVLLVHPGGPFFSKKDEGSWSIPKGEPNDNEDLFETAKREFEEETGVKPGGKFLPLGAVKQKSGKIVWAWTFEGDMERFETKSFFDLEWPPKSGKMQKFPEVDRAEFFTIEEATKKINSAQIPFLERLQKIIELNVNV